MKAVALIIGIAVGARLLLANCAASDYAATLHDLPAERDEGKGLREQTTASDWAAAVLERLGHAEDALHNTAGMGGTDEEFLSAAGRRLEEADMTQQDRTRRKSRGEARKQRLARARSRKAEIDALDSHLPRAHEAAQTTSQQAAQVAGDKDSSAAGAKQTATIEEMRKRFSFDVIGPYIEKHNEGAISSFSAGGIAATDEAASKSKDRLEAVLVASDTSQLPEQTDASQETSASQAEQTAALESGEQALQAATQDIIGGQDASWRGTSSELDSGSRAEAAAVGQEGFTQDAGAASSRHSTQTTDLAAAELTGGASSQGEAQDAVKEITPPQGTAINSDLVVLVASFSEEEKQRRFPLNMATGSKSQQASQAEWQRRQEAVVQACKETWAVYSQHAMGWDELTPLSRGGENTFGGMGAMVVDSLDTLWMFGLKKEFEQARKWVAEALDLEAPRKLSLFETTIRIVGGLLSAHDLSGDVMFLQKAQLLTEKLLIACPEDEALCNNEVHLNNATLQRQVSGQVLFGAGVALAEFGSVQMEFAALSHHSGDPRFAEKAEGMIERIDKNLPDVGLPGVYMSRKTGLPAAYTTRENSPLTVGAMVDSYVEYLLKMWLLGSKSKEMYRRRWVAAVDDVIANLTTTSPSGLLYVASRFGQLRRHQMEHLSCFLPGNIALGVMEGAVDEAKGQQYLDVAERLTYTCWQMYERTLTGLGLEIAELGYETVLLGGSAVNNRLRPEAVESFFYLWRATGKAEYRDWGWAVFQAFQQHCRTPHGAYASIADVNKVPVTQLDQLETFWTAETLKYLWLLFGSAEQFSLQEWVLNTEAHPLKPFAASPVDSHLEEQNVSSREVTA